MGPEAVSLLSCHKGILPLQWIGSRLGVLRSQQFFHSFAIGILGATHAISEFGIHQIIVISRIRQAIPSYTRRKPYLAGREKDGPFKIRPVLSL